MIVEYKSIAWRSQFYLKQQGKIRNRVGCWNRMNIIHVSKGKTPMDSRPSQLKNTGGCNTASNHKIVL